MLFDSVFIVTMQQTFHHLLKAVPVLGNQSPFEILQTSNTWRYQSLMIVSFGSVVSSI